MYARDKSLQVFSSYSIGIESGSHPYGSPTGPYWH